MCASIKDTCRARAIQDGSLSLLLGMSEKEIGAYH
jgi:hypothetical protein